MGRLSSVVARFICTWPRAARNSITHKAAALDAAPRSRPGLRANRPSGMPSPPSPPPTPNSEEDTRELGHCAHSQRTCCRNDEQWRRAAGKVEQLKRWETKEGSGAGHALAPTNRVKLPPNTALCAFSNHPTRGPTPSVPGPPPQRPPAQP